MNNDDINDEFDPENDAPSEFNPYENKNINKYDAFLENEEVTIPDDSETKRVEKNTLSQSSSNENNDDDSMELPDFMKSSSENNSVLISEFKKKMDNSEVGGQDDENPYRQNNDSEIKSDLNAEENNNRFDSVENENNNFSSEEADYNQAENSNSFFENEDVNLSGGNTEDIPEEIGFKPKVSASDADVKPGSGSKPKVLNKKYILTILIVVGCCALLFTFLMPTKKKDKAKNEKPVAETHYSKDYESMARKRPVEENDSGHYEDRNINSYREEKDEDVEIPPVIVKDEKPAYNPNNISYNTGKGNGSSSTIEIPDTRNDRLQGKAISGIKGLTSSQQSYSTDYYQTIEKNTKSTSVATNGFTMPSKEEYMNNVLGAYSQAYGNATSQNNSYAVQNDQSGKNSFFNNGRNGNNVGQGEWLNLNTLWQGTIFEATLTSELNTDLPGEITARIAKNIYSSQDGRYLLIPQNSIVYGTYNSSISYSQNRVQVAWHTLIRPDGYQIDLGSMNGTDAKGASGLKGHVNDHPMAYLKAIGLMSVFSIVNSEFSKSVGETQNEYVQNILANSQNVTVELGEKLIDRAMNVQPTIKIKSGTKINIVVSQNLSLPPCEDIPVTQPYHRK